MEILSKSSASSQDPKSSKSDAKMVENSMQTIHFDPEAHTSSGEKYDYITDESLLAKLKGLVGVNEKIKKVSTYRQNNSFWLYHTFVVIQTDNWWWSIEKRSEDITIQRSNQFNAVVNYYKQKPRNSPKNIADVEGSMGVYDLIKWLYLKKELTSKYHIMFNNCKVFADRVFQHVYEERQKRYILYREDIDENEMENSRMTAEELMSRVMECGEMKEDISIIRLCVLVLPTRIFVVCKTRTWLWSIENISNIIIIRRFDSETSLINRFSHNTSSPTEYICLKEDVGTIRINQLMEWLCQEDTFKKRFTGVPFIPNFVEIVRCI